MQEIEEENLGVGHKLCQCGKKPSVKFQWVMSKGSQEGYFCDMCASDAWKKIQMSPIALDTFQCEQVEVS